MQRFLLTVLLALCFLSTQAQDVRLPRTVKLYPTDVFRLYFSAGYEHGIKPRLSLIGFASYAGNALFYPVQNPISRSAECNTIWAANVLQFRAGTRFYPAKGKRHSPFYIDLMLAWKSIDFQQLSEYEYEPCDGGNLKPIEPLKTRLGLITMFGGALRRDKRFTMDLFGGFGIHNERLDERQTIIPPNPAPFFQPEAATTRVLPTLHLGLTLGWNFHGMRRG